MDKHLLSLLLSLYLCLFTEHPLTNNTNQAQDTAIICNTITTKKTTSQNEFSNKMMPTTRLTIKGLHKNQSQTILKLSCQESDIDLVIPNQAWSLEEEDFLNWVQDAVDSLLRYYGKFPIKKTMILIEEADGRGIIRGFTSFDEANKQGLIEIELGRMTLPEDLKNTWTLTHELVHLTLGVA